MTDVSDFLNPSTSVGSQNFNTFCKRHFNCPFFSVFFLQTPLMSVTRGSIDTKVAISVGNVLGSYRKQAITCTNYGLFYWCTYTSLGLDELTTAFIDAEPWKRIFFFIYGFLCGPLLSLSMTHACIIQQTRKQRLYVFNPAPRHKYMHAPQW